MLDSIRFVQGAVAKKDFVPALTHFRIKGGTIRGFNGALGICSPIELDLDCSPKAVPFVKAIQTCQDTIQMHLTPAGKLSIKSGKFKALVDCITEEFPEVEPEGETVQLQGGMIKALKTIMPFIAEDASRPWARGILFKGQSAFATNNICLVEYWMEVGCPVEINIPKSAVAELVRVGEEPTSLQVTENSATFHFPNGRWIRTQTYSTEWPDLGRILNQPGNLVPVPENLWEAVASIAPFVDDFGRVYMAENSIATGAVDGATGATMEVPGLAAAGCYNFQQLLLLEGVAEFIDFSFYPKPCPFQGGRVRGAIVGMRDL